MPTRRKNSKKVVPICNCCGKPCVGSNADADEGAYGLIDATFYGGYLSHEPIQDETRYRFSLCEKCLARLFATFKIPVAKVCLLDPLEAFRAGLCPTCRQETFLISVNWENTLLDDLYRAGIIRPENREVMEAEHRRAFARREGFYNRTAHKCRCAHTTAKAKPTPSRHKS
jgi:hypothetical protein